MNAVEFAQPVHEPRRAANGHDLQSSETQANGVVADLLAPGQAGNDAQSATAGGDTLPPTMFLPESRNGASAASLSDPGQSRCDAHTTPAGADLASDLSTVGAHSTNVAGNPLGGDQFPADAHRSSVAVNSYTEFALGMAAATLDDVEKTRTALNNRVKAMEREGIDATPEYATLKTVHDGIVEIEHQATLGLQRAMRKHPLGPWVKATVGVGEKQGARLIAAIGDPYWNTLEDRSRRGPAELWAYCGYAPGQKRRKGVKSNWNADAKMRAFLIAESCIKQMHSPYRADYDRARASWADRDTSDGHKHNHALRVVAKAVLRDLFLAARAAAA